MTIDETRAALARLPVSERCDPKCLGWIVSLSNRGLNIEVCDDCQHARGDDIYDDDVQALPEAISALTEEAEGDADRCDRMFWDECEEGHPVTRRPEQVTCAFCKALAAQYPNKE